MKKLEWTPRLVNQFWDGIAKTELDKLSFGKVAGPDLLNLISKYLNPGYKYLDFGAGSGHIVKLLLDRQLNVAAFEPSTDRQSHLKEKIYGYKNFSGVIGVDSLEKFEVVFLIEVVEHLLDEDFSTVLNRVSDFVKPGGYLIVTTPNNESLKLSSVYCPVCEHLFHPWQHVRSFSPIQLEQCFEIFGFSTDFLALADFSCDAPVIEDLKNRLSLSEDKLRDHPGLANKLQDSKAKSERILSKIGHVKDILGYSPQMSIWQKLTLRLKMLHNYRSLIHWYRLISEEMAVLDRELSETESSQSRTSKQVDDVQLTSIPRQNGTVDLRLGRETTIIYAGRKDSA